VLCGSVRCNLHIVLNQYSILTLNCIQNIFEPTINDDVQDSETYSETGENDLSPTNDTQSYRKPNSPLLALLQHFSVYTNQNHSDMIYLLMPLKLYEPEAKFFYITKYRQRISLN